MHAKNVLLAGALGIAACTLGQSAAHAQRGPARVIETVRHSAIAAKSATTLGSEAKKLKELIVGPEAKSETADSSFHWKFSALTGNLEIGTLKKFGHGEIEGGKTNVYAVGATVGSAGYCIASIGSLEECAQRAARRIFSSYVDWTDPPGEQSVRPSHSH